MNCAIVSSKPSGTAKADPFCSEIEIIDETGNLSVMNAFADMHVKQSIMQID